MIKNYTDNKQTNITINTRKMTVKEKILDAMKYLTIVEKIKLLDDIGWEIRQKNSIRISSRKFNELRVDEERPDLLDMK